MAKEKVKKTNKESYLKGVKKEMKLVKWPSAKDVVKNTIATVIMVVFVVGFFLLLTMGLAAITGWIKNV